MAYSDSFPSQRPSFMFDASNAGRIPPNMTYTRSTTGTYFGTEKVLSSENLLPYSENLGLWSQAGLLSRTGSQTDPAGGSTGFTLTENSSTGIHRITQNVTASGDLALTVYAKQNSGTRYLTLALYNSTGNTVMAVYDLAGSAPVTASGGSSTFTSITTSQTASGSGYYKCVLKATGTATVAIVNLNDVATTVGLDTNWGTKSYTGDGSSSIDLAFASLSTTGATDYSYTNGQIAREYQTKLQTAAINAPRFEYSATDGESMGILVEGQAQNLISYSSDSTQWTKAFSSLTGSAAVAPDGSLSASAWIPDTSLNGHYTHPTSLPTVASGTTYTGSVYVKSAGLTLCQLTWSSSGFGAGYKVNFNLAGSGSVVETAGGASGTISQCGNGWFRLTITAAATSSGSGVMVIGAIDSETSGRLPSYSGDGYNGLLLYGIQQETGSFASSLISTSGSQVSRGSDSLAVATAGIGFTGGPFTIVSETEGGQGNYPMAFSLSDESANNRVYVYRNSSSASDSTDWYLEVRSDGASVGSAYISSSASAGKLAVSYDLNDISTCASGGAVVTDTNAPLLPAVTELQIGAQFNETFPLNGHVKRVALYGEALSDTNLQALTS